MSSDDLVLVGSWLKIYMPLRFLRATPTRPGAVIWICLAISLAHWLLLAGLGSLPALGVAMSSLEPAFAL